MKLVRDRINSIICLIAAQVLSISSAYAQEAAPAAQPAAFSEVFARMVPLFIIVFFIFYFMVIKPQEKKLRAQEAMFNELKKGEQVVTDSGIIARVAGIEKDYILLEISNNARMKVERAHIAKKYEPKKQAEKSAA